jgi:hypothetical protein
MMPSEEPLRGDPIRPLDLRKLAPGTHSEI